MLRELLRWTFSCCRCCILWMNSGWPSVATGLTRGKVPEKFDVSPLRRAPSPAVFIGFSVTVTKR